MNNHSNIYKPKSAYEIAKMQRSRADRFYGDKRTQAMNAKIWHGILECARRGENIYDVKAVMEYSAEDPAERIKAADCITNNRGGINTFLKDARITLCREVGKVMKMHLMGATNQLQCAAAFQDAVENYNLVGLFDLDLLQESHKHFSDLLELMKPTLGEDIPFSFFVEFFASFYDSCASNVGDTGTMPEYWISKVFMKMLMEFGKGGEKSYRKGA